MASQKKKFLIFTGVVLVVLAIIAAIVVPIVVLRNNDDDENQELTSTTSTTTTTTTAAPQFEEFVRPAWGYECVAGFCRKVEITNETLATAISFPVCRMFCGEDVGTLWPKPTGQVTLANDVVKIDLDKITIKSDSFKMAPAYWTMAESRFYEMQRKKKSDKVKLESGGKEFNIEVISETDNMDMPLGYDESYTLKVAQDGNNVKATINSKTFFGARNGLETLSQVIAYDNIRNEFLTVLSLDIVDEPKYTHRGISLDTSRNYFSIESIKRTIEGMAMVKLNTFHWHMTDSHSWPLVLKSHPEITRLGAYSSEKIYTPEDISGVVRFAKARGVRVMPEFDAPAHVGEGFQHTDLVMCFNKQPWTSYCVEPPCGQFDPSKDKLYDVLEDIFREMLEYYENPEVFHMGGDEVDLRCWNTSDTLIDWMREKGWSNDEEGFHELWNYYQVNSLERLDKVSDKKMPIFLWTSTLTEDPHLEKYLDKERYIFQIWTTFDEPKNMQFLSKGYRAIVTNYDTLYLDCGFPGWVTDGHNWCGRYHGWHEIYENRMERVAGQYVSQIIGGEAALWTEQADEKALDSRIWPRASALAERLWSDPVHGWRPAESRMLMNRLRLVQVGGLDADRLQPEWCLQNEGDCPA